MQEESRPLDGELHIHIFIEHGHKMIHVVDFKFIGNLLLTCFSMYIAIQLPIIVIIGWGGVLGLEAEELVDLVITVFFYLFAEFVFSLKFLYYGSVHYFYHVWLCLKIYFHRVKISFFY